MSANSKTGEFKKQVVAYEEGNEILAISTLSKLKTFVLSSQSQPRTVKAGPFRGLILNIDLTKQSQLYLGLFEREVYKSLKLLSKDINTAIDIGAAAGEYTVYFLAKTAAHRVLAFEPTAADRDTLRSNLDFNGLADDARCEILPRYVGAEESNDVATLDSLLAHITFPCLIKMDVDGGEMDVLRGASELLRKRQVRWIIETHSPQLEEQCIDTLRRAGYATQIIPNAWWRFILPEMRPLPHNRWLTAMK